MSKKPEHYTQCIMTRPGTKPGVETHYVAWIPSQFAKKGRNISLKFEDGSWSDWVVADPGATKEAKYVEAHERDYLTQRKASDI